MAHHNLAVIDVYRSGRPWWRRPWQGQVFATREVVFTFTRRGAHLAATRRLERHLWRTRTDRYGY
jgi:hypothetical protein